VLVILQSNQDYIPSLVHRTRLAVVRYVLIYPFVIPFDHWKLRVTGGQARAGLGQLAEVTAIGAGPLAYAARLAAGHAGHTGCSGGRSPAA
jgi:hypothetical protein